MWRHEPTVCPGSFEADCAARLAAAIRPMREREREREREELASPRPDAQAVARLGLPR
jgi:hypothetical protein